MIKVKPLDWKPYRGGDAEAVALGTIYTAFVSGYWRTQKDPKFKKGGEDLEAAKAAAQAHHDALILSMVEIPSPQSRAMGLYLTEGQQKAILSVASRMEASPESVLKRAIGSYCAKFGGDGPIGEPDETNVVVLSAAVDNQPVKNGESVD